MLLLIRVIIIFPRLVSLRRRRSFTSRKLYVTVETFVCFFHQFDRHSVSRDRCIGFFLLYPFWQHMILISLAVHAQVCRLSCVSYIPLLGLLQARHDGERSFVWISPCGRYFKNTLYGCSCLCNSFVCENVRHFAHIIRCSSAGCPAFCCTDMRRSYNWLTASEQKRPVRCADVCGEATRDEP